MSLQVKLKDGFDEETLEEHGYTYNILEAGYVSPNIATIVIISRSPYERQVHQFRSYKEEQHKDNLKYLHSIGAINLNIN